jgi:hypothetical protein
MIVAGLRWHGTIPAFRKPSTGVRTVPNNREWAIFFWLVVFLTWALIKIPGSRRSIVQLASTFFRPPLSPAWSVMAVWVAGEVLLAVRVSAWDLQLTADTILWFITSALVMFMKLPEVGRRDHYFLRKAVEAFTITAVVQAYVSLVTLNLIGEFILQPILGFVALLYAFAQVKSDYRMVRILLERVLVLVSVALVVYVTSSLVHTWSDVDKPELLRQIGLPMWLTIGLLPCGYVLALYIAYNSAFFRIGFASGRRRPSWRQRAALLLTLHLRLRAVSEFASVPWPERFASASTFAEQRRVARGFLSDSRKTKAA